MLFPEILKKERSIKPALLSINKFCQIIFCLEWVYILNFYYYDIRYAWSWAMLSLVLISSFYIITHLVLLRVKIMTSSISLFIVLNIVLLISNATLMLSNGEWLQLLPPYVLSYIIIVITVPLGIISIVQVLIQNTLKNRLTNESN